MAKHKIEIPKPCSENWDNMPATDNGKYCKSCDNVVVDFTSMTAEEIQEYFIQYREHKTCGHFKSSQVANRFAHLQAFLENVYEKAENTFRIKAFSKVYSQ